MVKGYIKSPLNYTGGKFKLLPQILSLMPDDIENFVDLFCGGCNVAVNVDVKGKKYCNDIESHVIDFYKGLQENEVEVSLHKVKEVISKYNLNKENREGFLSCREDYNKNKTWYMFYAVVSHAFNNQIRYNKNGEYNMPFGKNRSSFNPSLEKKFIEFASELSKNEDYIFSNLDFREMDLSHLTEKDLVYCDPPYLVSTAAYNEGNGWTEQDEIDLYDYLDNLNDNGLKFILSNVFENKGVSNDILKEWSKKYTVHYLNHSYANCSYHGKNKDKPTVEVVITNF